MHEITETANNMKMNNHPNTLYPGQPEYVGPDSGPACWVHHDVPIEYCTSFAERIAYIRAHKPAHEQAVRLAALTCLPVDQLPQDLVRTGDAYRTAWDAFGKARDAYRTAWDAFGKARDAYTKAGAAYKEARSANDKAWAAYKEARDDYDQASDAYNKTEVAYNQRLFALMVEYVPARLWRDQCLIFTEGRTPCERKN